MVKFNVVIFQNIGYIVFVTGLIICRSVKKQHFLSSQIWKKRNQTLWFIGVIFFVSKFIWINLSVRKADILKLSSIFVSYKYCMFFWFFSCYIFIDNKCYKIVQDTTLNFNAATKACSDQGKEYSLVSIHSDLENGNMFLIFT